MSFVNDPGFPVGTLVQSSPDSRGGSNEFIIYSNDEVYIGRDKKRCQYVIEDPFISNIHLRIYTIVFDHDNPEDLAPLVYAQDISMNGTMWNDYPMGKGSGSFLLSSGDMLQLSPNSYLMFRRKRVMEEDSFDLLQQLEMEAFENQYVITERKLGSGAYGKVHMAYKKETGQQLACKIVDIRIPRNMAIAELGERKSVFFEGKPGGSAVMQPEVIAARERKEFSGKMADLLDSLNREAMILEHLCHPNIISVEKVIKSSDTIYIFQELVTAGDLFSFVQYKGGRLGDIEAAVIVRQILLALDYLHGRNIVHRDLKPENILMTSLVDGGRVVLTDFGCARLVEPAIKRMSTIVGTLEFCAPEINRSNHRGYTKAVDLWSLGCVTAVLLIGDHPFGEEQNASNPGESAANCGLERVEDGMEWNGTGNRAKDFVRQLLILDETKRMNVKQALRHTWFTNPAHKREFEALYRRSIRNWRPRVRNEPLIVDFSSFVSGRDTDSSEPSQVLKHTSPPKLSGGRYIEEASHSHNKNSNTSAPKSSLLSNRASNLRREAISPTLSDVALPIRSKNTKASQTPSQYPPASSNTSGLAAQVQTIASPDSLMEDIQYTSPPPNERDNEPVYQTHPARKSEMRPARLHHTIERPGLRLRDNHPNRMMTNGIWDGFEDEVYEEVNNMVTGESQRLVYGVGGIRAGSYVEA